MTSRLGDVIALTLGLYFIAVGILFAVDSSGLREIGVAGLVEGAVGLALIALGVLALLAAIRIRRFSRRLSRAIGHVRTATDWNVDDAAIRTVLGDIHLDLRDAALPEGETELTLLCWIGTIQVRVPANVGLDIEAQVLLGTVDLLGLREEGVVRDITLRTEEYSQASRRLRLHLSTVVGELLVVRSER